MVRKWSWKAFSEPWELELRTNISRSTNPVQLENIRCSSLLQYLEIPIQLLQLENRVYNNENHVFISFKTLFSYLYAQLSEPTLYLHNCDGDCSPMVLLVGRILSRNVKRKQEYLDPYPKGKLSPCHTDPYPYWLKIWALLKFHSTSQDSD